MNLRSILAPLLGAGLFLCSFAHAAAGDAHIVQIKVVPSQFSPDAVVVHAGETTTLRFYVGGTAAFSAVPVTPT